MRAFRGLPCVALVGALGACHGHAADEAEAPAGRVHARCEAVAVATLPETRTLRGSLQLAPERLARVAAEVPGRVQRLAVREGDAVVAGQLVAEIDTQPLQERAQTTRGELAGARAAVAAAQTTVTRLEPLVAHGVASQQELDDARARVAQARAILAQFEGTAQQARTNLARATLRAPLAGVVLRVLRGAGELVDGTPATPVVEVGDPTALEYVANATADDLLAARTGQHAMLVLGATDAPPVAAVVDRVALGVDPVTGIGAIRLRMETPRPLPVGLTGEARLVVDEHRDVLTVPEHALRERDGDHADVLVCAEGHAAVRAVRVGITAGDRVEVREGLARGDRVVAEHVVGVEDGAALQEAP